MTLTLKDIENAKPGDRPSRRFDGKGLYLEVAPSGGKWWRLKYRLHGKDKRLALGVYPDVGLADARKQCDAARKLLAQGIDPSAVKREQKARASAERLAKKNESAVQLRVALDGAVEIWKGRALVKLKSAEACAVRDLLIRLTA